MKPDTTSPVPCHGASEPLPPLEAGELLDQPTFHARYEAMPPGTRAELIEGVVHMPSSMLLEHAIAVDNAGYWLTTYRLATPGTSTGGSATCIMGLAFEPQPDNLLMIVPGCGGQVRIRRGYAEGAPELVLEVALSTGSIDLHAKRRDYERHGVFEYVVLALRQRRVYWFVREGESFIEMPPGEDGLHRSRAFPGLWLDGAALLADNMPGVLLAIQRGLATPEHAAFVALLASRRASTP